ncbi:MAG: alpha/beta hydrolase [Cyanobacteria bacterium]|nr:alpha/beta hydrolase [Cyanobacteriota bacterium]MDA0866965.1 alpha/beta hydrolase [Cyanobacteriota bacterium]
MNKKTLDLTPYPVAYWDQGQGPAIVFLHGFLGDANTWCALAQPLAPHFRCIALDLLGFGESAQPKLRYTIWDQVAFLHQVLQALELQDFYLVGHSYGGWVAVAYALALAGMGGNPEKTAWVPTAPLVLEKSCLWGLGLVAPAGIRDDSFVGRYTHLKPLLWETPLVDWAIAALAPIAALTGKTETYQTLHQARQAFKAQPVAKSFIVDRLEPEDAIDTVERFLGQIQVPTLVFAGEADQTIPLWHCQTYAAGLSEAQLIAFPETDHDLPQSQVEAIAAHLISHWQG